MCLALGTHVCLLRAWTHASLLAARSSCLAPNLAAEGNGALMPHAPSLMPDAQLSRAAHSTDNSALGTHPSALKMASGEPIEQRQQRRAGHHCRQGHRAEGVAAADVGAGGYYAGQLLRLERLADDAMDPVCVEARDR